MAYASLMASGLPDSEQMLHWAHAIDCSTLMRNLQPRGEWSNAFEPFNEDVPVKPEHLVKFGARGWMTKREKIRAKWTPKAEEVICVGYAPNHSSDTYVVRKLSNGEYVYSRDIKWDEPKRYRKLDVNALQVERDRQKLLAKDPSATVPATEFHHLDNRFAALVSDSDTDDDDSSSASEEEEAAATGRVARELRKLAVSFNNNGGGVRGRTRGATRRAETVQNVVDGPKDPKTDREAMEGPEREQWWQGLLTEYDGFFNLGTWKLRKAKDCKLGAGNKPLTTKTVYKKKLHAITKEIRHRVRNVIRGFDMVPGVHYDESFAPTPPNETIRIVFALSLWILEQLGVEFDDLDRVEKEDWVVGDLFDVVQAFLNSDMDPDQPVYIRLPPLWKEYCEARGIEYDPTDLIELGKAQYGQVDAAKRWMDMFVSILTEEGGCELVQSKIDPCVLYKRREDKLVALAVLYVDDGWIAGEPKEVKAVLEHLKTKVDILEVGRMDTHLRVNYKLLKDEIGWYYECDMKEYIDEIVSDFEEYITVPVKDHRSPGVPGSCLSKLPEDEEPIDIASYRKFVGKLLYAVMKVLPDCNNAVRDLTCHLSAPGNEHWVALERVIGHLKHHYKPLKLRAPRELRAVTAFDADWGTDKDDRKSISSVITTLGGTSLINWQCRKQTSVALSTCEAETMASTPAGQDTMYVNNLITEIMGKVELPSHV